MNFRENERGGNWKRAIIFYNYFAKRTLSKIYRKIVSDYKSWLFSSFPPPSENYKTKLFINSSHGNLHVRNVVEICSPVHADTF